MTVRGAPPSGPGGHVPPPPRRLGGEDTMGKNGGVHGGKIGEGVYKEQSSATHSGTWARMTMFLNMLMFCDLNPASVSVVGCQEETYSVLASLMPTAVT